MNPDFFLDALKDNPSQLPIRAESIIVEQNNGKAVVATQHLDLNEYVRLELCSREKVAAPRPLTFVYWGGEDHDRLYDRHSEIVWKVNWNDHVLEVVHLEWEGGCGSQQRDWVVAASEEIAREFILDVERKTNDPGQAILVFAHGHWERSRSLYQATEEANFDDLILAENLRDTIRTEFKQFLASEKRYESIGIAWRRGALFIGPPGNGKTHCVRALVRELGIPILYVQSLSHPHYTPEQLWSQVFNRARKLKPCVLVLEDLDSLVDDNTRSFFLNQLDGFEKNHGMIIIATTNYPEKIDSAIVDRPSRFDRKYHFDLPTLLERQRFLETWQQRLSAETGWKADTVADSAESTEGFSFAYLKELVISTVMQWMSDEKLDFGAVMLEQVAVLAKQLKTSEPNE